MEFIEKFLEGFHIYHFKSNEAKKFGQMQAFLRKNGTPIGDFDVGIASIVMECDEILLTRNKKHFRHIPLLQFKNWDETSWNLEELGP